VACGVLPGVVKAPSHVERVNAALALSRALWKLRSSSLKTTEQVLTLQSTARLTPEEKALYHEVQRQLRVLRKAWPFTDLWCTEVAKTVVQAASEHFWGEMKSRPDKDEKKPEFYDTVSRRHVVRATLTWMSHISNRKLSFDPREPGALLLSRIQNDSLPIRAARALRDQLIQNMPGILQWIDEQTGRPKIPASVQLISPLS
jgi:hypothetical protein